MPAQAFTGGTFYGSSVALTAAPSLFADTQPGMVKWSGYSREEIETTHLASGGKSFIAGDIPDWGTIEVMTKYSTQLDHATLFLAQDCDTLTVTHAKRAVTCGGAKATTAATAVFSVVYTGATVDWDDKKPMNMTHKFRVVAPPTFTAAQT